MPEISQQQLDLLHHTLGLRPDQRRSYRNHYVAGPGHYAMPDLEALVALELMALGRTPAFCDQTDVVFHVTRKGERYAEAHLPPPPKKTRFDEYLDYDSCDSFGEFLLGAKVPRYEHRGGWRNGEWRMYRCTDFFGIHREVEGDWCRTQKEAKASYKAALKQHQAAEKAAA